MPFASYKNSSVEYTVTGEGKGLVLIHRTAQTAQNTWAATASHFTPTHRVVCPNYSGSGRTTDNEQELAIAFLAEQVLGR